MKESRCPSPAIAAKAAIQKFAAAGYMFLAISVDHAAMTETLPPIHADPFDRLLVAQALVEPMRLLTRDTLLSRYAPTIMQV